MSTKWIHEQYTPELDKHFITLAEKELADQVDKLNSLASTLFGLIENMQERISKLEAMNDRR